MDVTDFSEIQGSFFAAFTNFAPHLGRSSGLDHDTPPLTPWRIEVTSFPASPHLVWHPK